MFLYIHMLCIDWSIIQFIMFHVGMDCYLWVLFPCDHLKRWMCHHKSMLFTFRNKQSLKGFGHYNSINYFIQNMICLLNVNNGMVIELNNVVYDL